MSDPIDALGDALRSRVYRNRAKRLDLLLEALEDDRPDALARVARRAEEFGYPLPQGLGRFALDLRFTLVREEDGWRGGVCGLAMLDEWFQVQGLRALRFLDWPENHPDTSYTVEVHGYRRGVYHPLTARFFGLDLGAWIGLEDPSAYRGVPPEPWEVRERMRVLWPFLAGR